jgi:ABC-type glycerol-3-phosphate transport system substrate-binding protein
MEFNMRKAGLIVIVSLVVAAPFATRSLYQGRFFETGTEPPDQIELTFWDTSPGSEWHGYWDRAAARFEAKNPGIKIRHEYVKIRHLRRRFDLAYANGSLPDLFSDVIGQLGVNAESGEIAALDEFVADWDDGDDLMEAAKDAGRYGEHIYAIGHWFSPIIFIYRKDFFAESGLDPEAPPTTWEELAEYAVRLTLREDRHVTRAGFDIATNDVGLILSFGRQNGGRLFTDEGLPDIDTDAWVEMFEYFQDLVVDKQVNIVVDRGEFLQTLYLDNKAAISPVYAGTLSSVQFRESGLRDVSGVFRTKRKMESAWRGCAMMHVTTASRHKEAAWKFYAFVLSEDETWKRYLATGAPVIRESLIEQYLADDPVMNAEILHGIKNGRGVPKQHFNLPLTPLLTAFERVLYEDASPREELERAQKKWLMQLADNE